MKEIVNKLRYDLVYEHTGHVVDVEKDIDYYRKSELVQYILHDGYKLYIVKTRYTKKSNPVNHYIAAKDERELKDIIDTGWLGYRDMTYLEYRLATDEEVEKMLNNPKKYMIV